jgi:hypothetical protein
MISAFLRPGLDQLVGDGQGRGGEEAVQLALDQGPGLVLGEPLDRFQLGLVGGGRVAVDVGHQAHHQRRGPGPGLAGVIAHRDSGQAGLLLQLAGAAFLDGLAGLDEAGQGRVHAGRPQRLAAQQAAAVVQGQHDRHRVGAREVLGLAGGALALPAAVGDVGLLAAVAAPPMLAPPFEHRLGGGQDAGVGRRQGRATPRSSSNRPSPCSGPSAGSAPPSRSTANTAMSFHRPRNSSRSGVAARSLAMSARR